MELLKKIGFALWSVVMVVVGFFAYSLMDKPDLSVTNNYKKLKAKGQNNKVDNTTVTNVKQEQNTTKTKKRFRFFKKRGN